jgi:hypothetical protein
MLSPNRQTEYAGQGQRRGHGPGNGVAAAKVSGSLRILFRTGQLLALGYVLTTALPDQPVRAQAAGRAPPAAQQEPVGGWGRVPLAPGTPVDTRPQPPKEGRKACISVKNVAGAQLFGDSAIELTMKNGKRYRMFFATECPALTFYQGFYYRRQKAGQLCAGRDVVGARSGGECPIASIIPVRIPKR